MQISCTCKNDPDPPIASRLKNDKISKNAIFNLLITNIRHFFTSRSNCSAPISPRQSWGQRENVCDKKDRALQTEVKKRPALENEWFKVIN